MPIVKSNNKTCWFLSARKEDVFIDCNNIKREKRSRKRRDTQFREGGVVLIIRR